MTRWPVDPAELLLGGLTAEERLIAERLVREDPAFRAEVERLRGVAVALTATGAHDPGSPPALDLDAARAARPAPAGRRRSRRRRIAPLVLRPATAGAAAVLLVATGVGGGLLLGGGEDEGAPVAGTEVRLAALEGAPAPRRALVALRDDAAGLDVRGLTPSRRGEHYELWLLNSAKDLVSVGTFRVGADGRVAADFPLGVDPGRYAFVDVSVEPDDGDPGHSSRSVLRSARLT